MGQLASPGSPLAPLAVRRRPPSDGWRRPARLPVVGRAGVRRRARRGGRPAGAIARDTGHGLRAPARRLGRRVARPRPRAGPGPGGGGAWRRLPRARRAAVVAVAGAGYLSRWDTCLGPPRPPRVLKIRFLDVGQGDATLIQDPSGAAILFDAGPPKAAAWRLVRRAECAASPRRGHPPLARPPWRDRRILDRFPVDVVFDGGDGTRDRASGRWNRRPIAWGSGGVVARAGTAFAVVLLHRSLARCRRVSVGRRLAAAPSRSSFPRSCRTLPYLIRVGRSKREASPASSALSPAPDRAARSCPSASVLHRRAQVLQRHKVVADAVTLLDQVLAGRVPVPWVDGAGAVTTASSKLKK